MSENKVSHPYKAIGKIMVLNTLILTEEDKGF